VSSATSDPARPAGRSANAAGKVEAIAGLASGSDILFHEICGELDVARTAGLALPEG